MPTILAADIGATNSRFAFFKGGETASLRLVNKVWLPTKEAASFAQMLERLEASDLGLALDKAGLICLAAAGPVQRGSYCQPPHVAWDIDLARDIQGLGPSLLINDFVAQAWACLSPVALGAITVLEGQADPHGARAVIGAGSNLGHAALVPDGQGGWTPVASEAGHAAFAFNGQDETAYAQFLGRELGDPYPISDTVVSGKGLSFAHQFLTGQKLEPAQVGEVLNHYPDTLHWMARFYGRACRQWALQVVALGGVYIAGGLAAKLPALVRHPAFGREFRLADRTNQVLRGIPVFLIQDENSGLWGAAAAALERLEPRG
ncbi:MAG: glucokinase [Proteobacteria bacterium]|nr:glucokinase [Pseudomonadota bacterium]MBU1452418.1 glucokinase [Pseudomonadota bacterium]MBU2467685.1 glucokinase [Pseudomonadota bacterium]MBU2518237.1 glucokinase [Pseudomonadota bacterium]